MSNREIRTKKDTETVRSILSFRSRWEIWTRLRNAFESGESTGFGFDFERPALKSFHRFQGRDSSSEYRQVKLIWLQNEFWLQIERSNVESGVVVKIARFFTISPRFFHFPLRISKTAFKFKYSIRFQLVFHSSKRVRQNDGAKKCTSSEARYVELQRKESIVELLLLRGGVWAQQLAAHNVSSHSRCSF